MILRLLLIMNLLALSTAPSFAAPKPGEPDPSGLRGREFDRRSDKKPEPRRMEDATLDQWQRFQTETAILSRLELSRDQMKSLVREFRKNPAEYQSFQHLVRSASSAREDAALLKGYFQLLSHAAGEFHLSPARLETRMKTWSSSAKEHLGEVLQASAQLVREGKAATREQAFQLGLKKYGLDGQYQRNCRKG